MVVRVTVDLREDETSVRGLWVFCDHATSQILVCRRHTIPTASSAVPVIYRSFFIV